MRRIMLSIADVHTPLISYRPTTIRPFAQSCPSCSPKFFPYPNMHQKPWSVPGPKTKRLVPQLPKNGDSWYVLADAYLHLVTALLDPMRGKSSLHLHGTCISIWVEREIFKMK